MHPARVVLRLCEECSARGVVTHGAHYALLARRRLERSAASLSGVCQRVFNPPTCVDRRVIVAPSVRRGPQERRRGVKKKKGGAGRGGQNAALWREKAAETEREAESDSLAEDCRSRALPNMSSQAKVKKDKEIIAEYETQVKGW